MPAEERARGRLPAVWTAGSRLDVGLLAANAAGQALAAAATALLVSRGFDDLFELRGGAEGAGMQDLVLVAGSLVSVGMVAAWLRMDEAVRAQRLGQRYVHRLRLALWDHLLHTPWSQLARRRRSGVLLRFTGDLRSLQSWITHGMIGGGVAAAIAVGALAALGSLSPSLAVGVLLVLAGSTLVSVGRGGRLRGATLSARHARSRLIDDIEERVDALASVQVCGQGRRERRRLTRRSRRVVETAIRSARVAGELRAVGDLGTLLVVVVVMLVAGHEVTAGRAAVGAAVAALVVSRFLVGPLRRVARAHRHWHQAQVARQKFEQFLARPTPLARRRRTRLPAHGGGRIDLHRLMIDGVLKEEVTSSVPVGARLAVVGPNGAGKSTLLRVLAGLEPPGRGGARLDGRDVARCRPEVLRRAIGFVGPDQPLMRGTVRRNLLYRWPAAPESEIARVLDETGLREVFPSLDARVARRGGNLSTGQRQRLLLARALVGGPRLLLLDEPESHLDEAGMEVLKKLVDHFPGTVVWVSHDPTIASRATVVWRLESGALLVREKSVGLGVALDMASRRRVGEMA